MTEQQLTDETDNDAGETQMGDEAPAAPDELTILKQRAKLMGISHSGNIGVDALRAKINAKLAPPADEVEEEEEETTSQDEGEDEVVAEPEPLSTPKPAVEAEFVPQSMAQLQAEIAQLRAQITERTRATALNPLEGDVLGEVPAVKKTKRQRIVDEATKLIRVRITNMDPKKKDLSGEILCVGNRYIGTVRKFIPYGEATDDGYHIPKILFDELESRKFVNIRTFKDRRTKQTRVEHKWAKEFAIEVLPPLTVEELGRLAIAQAAAGSIVGNED